MPKLSETVEEVANTKVLSDIIRAACVAMRGQVQVALKAAWELFAVSGDAKKLVFDVEAVPDIMDLFSQDS